MDRESRRIYCRDVLTTAPVIDLTGTVKLKLTEIILVATAQITYSGSL